MTAATTSGAAEANMAKGYAAGEGLGARGGPGRAVARRQRADQGVRDRLGADRIPAGAHRPVSREMVLNFVAQTSLGLPCSVLTT